MTATNNLYNHTAVQLNQGVDLENDTLVMLLTTSAHTPSGAHTNEADIDNEVSGNGYARQTLTGLAYSQEALDDATANDARFSANDAVFTADGGDIVSRYWHLLDTTADVLLDWGLIDDQDVDVTVTDGNELTLTLTDGILEVRYNPA